MAALDASTRAAFLSDLRSAQHAVTFGVTPSRASAANTHWRVWTDFCTQLAIDPLLQDVPDPMALLQVFCHRYRTGAIAPNRHPVRARTAENALRSVGQTFAAMGTHDPRLTPGGNLDFRLARQLRHYKIEDPPPHRVKPLPVTVLRWLLHHTHTSTTRPSDHAIADMIALAFFFLLRPGEYTATPSDTTPFHLSDVTLSIGSNPLPHATASDAAFSAVTFVTLTFTTQKNGTSGEVLGLGRSGDPYLCPVAALIRRVRHLHQHRAPAHTPLSVYYENGSQRLVTPADITLALQTAVLALNPTTLNFDIADISARSLRASGAMALLCGQVDTDVIRLLGRWHSDAMFRYLHLQAEPVMRNFSHIMLTQGNFTLNPTTPHQHPAPSVT